MKLSPVFYLLVILSLASCSSQRVTRVDPGEQIDLSGKWNDTDSRLTAEELTDQALGEDWLGNFLVENQGEKPVLIVGFVKNKSHEYIDAETFMKNIERSFIKSQRVRLVQGGEKRDEVRAERADQQDYASEETMKRWGLEIGADFMMQGTINSIVDAGRREKVVFYQVDLELTHMETNEIVWIGEKQIKKLVK